MRTLYCFCSRHWLAWLRWVGVFGHRTSRAEKKMPDLLWRPGNWHCQARVCFLLDQEPISPPSFLVMTTVAERGRPSVPPAP